MHLGQRRREFGSAAANPAGISPAGKCAQLEMESIDILCQSLPVKAFVQVVRCYPWPSPAALTVLKQSPAGQAYGRHWLSIAMSLSVKNDVSAGPLECRLIFQSRP